MVIRGGNGLDFLTPAVFDEYVRCYTLKTIAGSCRDYRATGSNHGFGLGLLHLNERMFLSRLGTSEKGPSADQEHRALDAGLGQTRLVGCDFGTEAKVSLGRPRSAECRNERVWCHRRRVLRRWL
jgi:hypothetical protein